MLCSLVFLISSNLAAVPHIFSPGESISSQKINENFQGISSAIYGMSCSDETLTSSPLPTLTCLSLTLTPSSLSSKLMISGSAYVRLDGSGTNKQLVLHLFRDGVQVGDGVAYTEGNDYNTTLSFSLLDEPNSTSPVEYEIRLSSPNGQTVRVNYAGAWANPISFLNVVEGK